jgi:hypothetical protein
MNATITANGLTMAPRSDDMVRATGDGGATPAGDTRPHSLWPSYRGRFALQRALIREAVAALLNRTPPCARQSPLCSAARSHPRGSHSTASSTLVCQVASVSVLFGSEASLGRPSLFGLAAGRHAPLS